MIFREIWLSQRIRGVNGKRGDNSNIGKKVLKVRPTVVITDAAKSELQSKSLMPFSVTFQCKTLSVTMTLSTTIAKQ
ncbi:hypothetical protein AAY473_027275, partial [Plecturocebus cupreus]